MSSSIYFKKKNMGMRGRNYLTTLGLLLIYLGLVAMTPIQDTQSSGIHVPQDFSVEAEQILLDLKAQLNFTKMTERPIPLYRKDLPADNVAYWLVVFDAKDYVIISAGPQTGDYKFRFQGTLPTVTSYVNKMAAENEAQCYKFYMLTPEGVEVMCEDEKGHVIASTISDELLRDQTLVEPYESLVQQYVDSRLCDLRVEWARHGVEVNYKGEWMDEKLLDENHDIEEKQKEDESEDDVDEEEMDEDEGIFGTATDNNFDERAIRPGETQKLALGDSAMIKDVFLKYKEVQSNPDETLESYNMTFGQSQICKVVLACHGDTSQTIHKEAIQIDKDTGLAYLKLRVSHEAHVILGGSDVHFVIELHRLNGALVKYHYGLVYSATRERRRKETEGWSAWTVKSIKDENLFPHYKQHTPRNSKCPVGCGPVAWAMIFGYFDRRSHRKSYRYGSGSQSLFRSGSDGTTGSSSAEAPEYYTDAIGGYTEKLKAEMGTFCLGGGGATLMDRMHMVSRFFKARQLSGSPYITQKKTIGTAFGTIQSSIASWARDRIDEGWPVVVGTKNGFLQWHYPVVTEYRTRTRQYRSCSFRCGAWKTEYDYNMKLHQGWGGTGDGWTAMRVFFAIAAKY